MHGIAFDIAHLLAGTLVLVSIVQLYQDRLSAVKKRRAGSQRTPSS
jgi:hydrogenase-4 component E